MTVNEYIKENLPLTVRECPVDDGPFFALPKPYNVPCPRGMFQEMYYWDTYFTNIGHLIDGNVEEARNNVENLAAMAERFGFVLNGNREEFLNNSQPPFLSQAIREVYEVTGDKEWLARMRGAVEREYAFYTEKRGSEIGLSHYDAVMPISEKQIKRGAKEMVSRMGYRPELDEETLARGLFAVGESGWDVNPRMTYRAYEIVPAELNALIYSIEMNMAYFSRELGLDDEEKWLERARVRAERCRKYLKGEDGVFHDYDLAKRETTSTVSAACLYPLYFGMATEDEAKALVAALPLIETDFGIVTCQEMPEVKGNFQWGYPNGWPPMQILAVAGLLRYGYEKEAKRIAQKFKGLIEKCFGETRHLWEKYDVVKGSAEALAEYETPVMLGWTFGSYRYMEKVLGE